MAQWASWRERLPARALQRRLLLLEAAAALVVAYLMIHLLPFRLLEVIMSRPVRGTQLRGGTRQAAIAGIRWAVTRASRRLPFTVVCFPRALAAQMMLRHRRVATTLYYGAATLPGKGLTAHTWLQDGALGIVEHAEAAHFHVVARYPQAQP